MEINLCKIQEKMEKSFKHFKESLSKIRAGTANANIDLLSTIKISYNGKFVPLNNVANVNVTNAMTLTIQPWERKVISSIYKSLIKSNLGFTPINNGEVIFIYLPTLTEERRKELIKKAKIEIEKGKISIRTIRKDANNNLKKKDLTKDLFKKSENSLQKLTDLYINKIDDIANIKEKEILNI